MSFPIMKVHMQQNQIDAKNAQFWNELCGSSMARSLGITEVTPQTLEKYDQYYLAYYPYLRPYVTKENLLNKKVLEIGLGYGTLGQCLMKHGSDYYGLDIAEGPVAMMGDRMRFLGKEPKDHLQVGSVLNIPFPDQHFDFVYTIGCLHHTGDIPRSVDEIYRVLRPGGKAIVMLYNRHSYRQLVQIPLKRMLQKQRPFTEDSEWIRSLYDTDSTGQAAPHTEYVSRRDVQRLFRRFTTVKVQARNFEDIIFRNRVIVPRSLLLNNLGRILGLDLYIVAKK
jgi:SAM-dependent methyltransferase